MVLHFTWCVWCGAVHIFSHTQESTKYLGSEMSRDMTWKLHIDRTVKKGNSTLGFLRRNLRVSNEEVKSAAYFSIVHPTLEIIRVLLHCLESVPERPDLQTGDGLEENR